MPESADLTIASYVIGGCTVLALVAWATLGGTLERYARKHNLVRGDKDE